MHLINSISFYDLRTSAFICGCFLVLFCAAAPAFAQHGGKAEPLRIEFKHGTTTTTLNGVVRGSEEAEYVLAAKKGQRLIIKLTSVPLKSSCFNLKGPDQAQMGLDYDCNSDYSKALPATGDYFISATRTSQGKGTSRYRMTITVR